MSDKDRKLRIGVACGGTGGHIFPGLATAEVLVAEGHDVTLWLAGKDVEAIATEHWDGPIQRIKAQGLPSGISLRSLKAALSLLRAVWICYRLMRKDRPQVMLAMGSYASVGPVLAAWLLRVPIVLHEANVMPGKAIRFLAGRARVVACAFKETQSYLPAVSLVVTGMPLRSAVEHRDADCYPEPLDRHLFTFLVMGGSRGAHRLNDVVTQSFCDLAQDGHRFQVIHLTGVADETAVRDAYLKGAVRAVVKAFDHDMPSLYNASDFAICRAGSATCSELAVFGLPALFIPYPYAGNHQVLNARVMADAQMADVIEERDLSKNVVAGYIAGKLNAMDQVAKMSAAAKRCATHDASQKLAALVCRTVVE